MNEIDSDSTHHATAVVNTKPDKAPVQHELHAEPKKGVEIKNSPKRVKRWERVHKRNTGIRKNRNHILSNRETDTSYGPDANR